MHFDTYMLLPLPEPGLFGLDLLSEALAQRLLLLFEFRVLELAGLLLAKLAYLHLSLPVVLVMHFLRRRDKVEHVRADEEGAKLAEVAVLLVLNWCSRVKTGPERRDVVHTLSNTPKVLATLHDTTVLRRHVLSGADDGVRDRVRQDTGMLSGGLVIRVNGGLVDADALRLDDVPNLHTTQLRI